MNPSPRHGLELSYARRTQLRQEHGPLAAAVFDVIAHRYTGTAVAVSYQQMADGAGVSKQTARRSVDAMADTGWLKREHHFTDHHQQANRYLIPSFLTEEGGVLTGHPNSSFLIDEKTDKDSEESRQRRQRRDEDRSIEEDRSTEKTRKKEHTLPPTELLGVARPLAGETPRGESRGEGRVSPSGGQGGGGEESGESPPSPWVPAGTKLSGVLPLPFPETPIPKPLPPGSNGLQAMVHHDREAWWLTSQLLAYLLARGDSPALITDNRVEGFHRSAFEGLSLHPLPEIAAILGLVFAVLGGDLPGDMTRDLDAYIPPEQQEKLRERKKKGEGKGPPRIENITHKVTNLHQILHPSHYAQLCERVSALRTRPHPAPRPADPLPAPTPQPQAAPIPPRTGGAIPQHAGPAEGQQRAVDPRRPPGAFSSPGGDHRTVGGTAVPVV